VCRHLAHLGPPSTLAALLLDPPHGLAHQAYAPADMRGGGTVNADGFGVGWYPPPAVRELAGAGAADAAPGAAPHGDPGADPDAAVPVPARSRGDRPVTGPGPDDAVPGQPARYRSDRPIWGDTGFAALAAVTPHTGVLAAVRSATVGMPVTTAAAAPFAEGPWLFSHNGVVRGWPDSVIGLAAALPVRDLLTLDAPTDSTLLWALVRHRLRAGDDPAVVLAETVLTVEAAAPGSRLNLLLTDGEAVWGTTWTHALSVRAVPGAVTVASEPTDPGPGWTAVPDRHLVVADRWRCEVRPVGAVSRAA
jgi:gamma-glutamyl hercynylcysteine S-oxide hydrolase